jgi:hypothetical protein
MTVAQFMTIHRILEDRDMVNEPSRKVNFTQYNSGRVTLRFMDVLGDFCAYSINIDGSYERVTD